MPEFDPEVNDQSINSATDDTKTNQPKHESEVIDQIQSLSSYPKWINNKGEEVKQVFGFNENAELNENCPQEYQGLDRYKAREKIISELKEKAVLSKEEENLHTVPYGDRSGEVIEPFLTDQWFVDAEKLSIEAINNVKNGNTKFIPSNWNFNSNNYFFPNTFTYTAYSTSSY